jgi:type VI secretion system secreted protein VgrG
MISRRRGDELQSRRERHWAVTGWSDVAAGRSFKYQGDPDASRNGEYIIASCTFVIGHPGYEGLGDGLAAPAASSTFDALLAGDGVSDGSQDVLRGIVESALEPKVGVRGARSFVLGLVTPSVPFRPPRVTPRKRMPGPQSAIVVGPKVKSCTWMSSAVSRCTSTGIATTKATRNPPAGCACRSPGRARAGAATSRPASATK